MIKKAKYQSARIQELDALRGIAALTVVLFHYTYKYNEVFTPQIMKTNIFDYGYLGVQLFFIISGYVIFMTISNVNSGAEFVYKRFIRLYPIFWICLIFTFSITSFSNIERFERSWWDLLVNITMIPDLLNAKLIDGVYWSLVPELFFYGMIWLIYKLSLIQKIEIVCLVWLIMAVIFKFVIRSNGLNLIFNADYAYLFIAGINFYILHNKKGNIINHLLILASIVFCFFTNSMGESLICLFFYGLFYLLIFQKLIFLRKFKFLVFVGVVSYPLYLIHQFFGLILINKLYNIGIENYFVLLLITVSIAIFLSWVLTKYVEKPILTKLKQLKFNTF